MYRYPTVLTCSVCLRDYWRVLNLPDDLQVDGPLPFSCANCNHDQHRYGAPDGMATQEWIRRVAAVGWQCSACGRPLNFDTVRHINGAPACSRCRDRAYRSKSGKPTSVDILEAPALVGVNHFSAR